MHENNSFDLNIIVWLLFVPNHSFSSTVVQRGMMFLPPPSLPYGGQIQRIDTTQFDRTLHEEHARVTRQRSLLRYNYPPIRTVHIDPWLH